MWVNTCTKTVNKAALFRVHHCNAMSKTEVLVALVVHQCISVGVQERHDTNFL